MTSRRKASLLTAWVTRRKWGPIAGLGVAALVGSWGLHYVNVARPQQMAEQQAHVEITQTLPAALRQAHADIATVSTEPAVRERAAALLADGERAIRDKDRAGMMRTVEALKALRAEVTAEYTLTIVSLPGQTSGVWRRPPKATQAGARNYYLVVEALAPDGRRLKLPIRNEETEQTETVEKFGVRVPKSVFDAVAADKRDDGIIQNNKFGSKRRGTLKVDYAMPFDGGMITRW